MNLKKMLLMNSSVSSGFLSGSSKVTRVSKMRPVGTKSSPKFINFKTLQALMTGSDVFATFRSV